MSVTKTKVVFGFTANLPAHKYRQPIDVLLRLSLDLRMSQILTPSLLSTPKSECRQGAYIASLDLSKIDGVNPDSIRRGLARVNMEWHFMVIRPQRLRRPMPADMFAVQIDRSRAAVIANARH